MNDRLSDALHYSFCNCLNRYPAPNQDSSLSSQAVIPVSEDVFEIPVFALCNSSVVENIKKGLVDTVVANVNWHGICSRYKSLNASFYSCITENFSADGLVKLPVKNGETDCYITHGAVFDHNLQPLLMLTWMLQKDASSEASPQYKYSLRCFSPTLRIAQQVITDKNHSVNRFIVGRILSSVLSFGDIYPPRTVSIKNYRERFFPRIIIESIPFTVRRPSVPSVNTSNDDLIHSALDHFDDFVL